MSFYQQKPAVTTLTTPSAEMQVQIEKFFEEKEHSIIERMKSMKPFKSFKQAKQSKESKNETNYMQEDYGYLEVRGTSKPVRNNGSSW